MSISTESIFESIVSELAADASAGLIGFDYPYGQLKGMFLLRRQEAPASRPAVYKALFLRTVEWLMKERNSLLEDVKGPAWNETAIEGRTKLSAEVGKFLSHLSPLAIPEMSLPEMLRLAGIWMDRKPIQVHDRWKGELVDKDLNESFFGFYQLIRMLELFQQREPVPDHVFASMRTHVATGNMHNAEWYLEQVAKLQSKVPGDLGIEVDPDGKPKEKRELSAEALATDKKKWKWLQEHPLGFVEERATFYSLMESLSQVDYMDHFWVTDELRAVLKTLDPGKYEAFVLDLHADSCADGGKRSHWFSGDRAVAYQITVWVLFELRTPNCYSILTKIAEKCFTKIPSSGATSRLVGDVVLRLLYESQSVEGLATLLKLKSRNKYPVFLEALEAAIRVASRYADLDVAEMEDFIGADYGLVDGVVERAFGEYVAQIRVVDFDSVEMNWRKGNELLKAEPAAVKNNFATDLKVWKAMYADVKKDLSGHRMRLENLWRGIKSWDYVVWKQYFFDHPLVRFPVRRLIWAFEREGVTMHGLWLNGRWVDQTKEPLPALDGTRVSLWHPAGSAVDEVVAWRQVLVEKELLQPFKQAYREVYLVTDAEVATSTCSLRFSRHVLRHHKLPALAQQRWWKYTKSDTYSGDSPHVEFAAHGIDCYWDLSGDVDYAVTGAVHFRRTLGNLAMRMQDVPVRVFSEAMRDIDLFVSVCTIGTEDEWTHEAHRAYWEEFSKTQLSELAQTRREVIRAILPKLRIKDRCTVTDKYLVVRGQLRTYKIHFGSGNILMEPNDQYLCIVADRGNKGGAEPVFLPFEGDAGLSLVISKALLLAEDDKITDTSITTQIARR